MGACDIGLRMNVLEQKALLALRKLVLVNLNDVCLIVCSLNCLLS